MARYGKKAQQKVKKAVHEKKRGKLRSGSTGKKVKSRKQAIAIGLSQARREGGKAPKKKTSSSRSRSTSSGGRKTTTRKKTTARKKK